MDMSSLTSMRLGSAANKRAADDHIELPNAKKRNLTL